MNIILQKISDLPKDVKDNAIRYGNAIEEKFFPS